MWVDKEEKEEDVAVGISILIKNTGDREGAEVIQIYVSDQQKDRGCPKKVLRAFEKVNLQAGEEKVVTFHLTKEAFSYYKEEKQMFAAEKGDYEILIGFASDDIKKIEKMTLGNDYYYRY